MSLVEIPLFDLPEDAIVAAEPAERLSADRLRTIRAGAALAAGRHPLGSRLHREAAPADDGKAPGLRCRGCAHVTVQGGTSGRYLKCDAHLITRGPASDLRLWWPACERFEAES